MSPEIRLKKPKNLVSKSLTETIITLIVLGLLMFGYSLIPQQKKPTFESEYAYLENTGQLYKTPNALDSAGFEKVTVVSITDGDTIKVTRADNSEATVRYIGIDTPEIKHQGNSTDEPYGQAAKSLNEWLVSGKTVYLQADATEIDKYGRLLRYVYREDGVMVNYVLIRLGYATIMTIPPNVAYQQQFYAGQEGAKKDGFNLFAPEN